MLQKRELERMPMTVTVSVISDTHLRHRELNLPGGDLLIHCGDMFSLGVENQAVITELDAWFREQDHDQVLCVGGNHDHALEAAFRNCPQPFQNAHYHQGASYSFKGLNLYGTPWVPNLPHHAFSARKEELAIAWANIPIATDILSTHTPPAGILDQSRRGQSYGCPLLLKVLKRLRPKVHCFGHVHASAGSAMVSDTLFVDASSLDSGTDRVLPAVSFVFAGSKNREKPKIAEPERIAK